MDHTDDFAQNWRVQGENNQPLDEQNIESFIKSHGVEQAIGYMRAIRDIVNELEFGLYDNRPEVGSWSRPLTRVKNNIEKLRLHKENFLASVDEKQLLKANHNPD